MKLWQLGALLALGFVAYELVKHSVPATPAAPVPVPTLGMLVDAPATNPLFVT